MKKVFLLTVAAIALLMTGCEVAPTEINQVSLPDKVTVHGVVRYTVVDKNGKNKDAEIVPNAEVIIFYGIQDPETGNMNYDRYPITADKEGYFTYKFGVKPGQVIDEVKIQSSLYVDEKNSKFETSYALNKVSNKMEESNTEYFTEVSKTNLVAGKSYMYDINMAPVAYTSDPDLVQPGEKWPPL